MLEVNFAPFPVLKTERLLLREIIPADAGELFYMRSSPVVMQYIDRERAKTIDDAQKMIALYDTLLKKGEGINWGITLSGSDEMVGLICLWQIQKENYRAEVGYMLHDGYHRRGIMNEALVAVIAYAFQRLQLHSLEAIVNPDNDASVSLLEKNGFVREGLFRENYFFNGRFLDSGVYSLLAPKTTSSQPE